MTELFEGYVSHLDAAERLGVTPRTLTRWNSLRKGPPFTRVGRNTYYRLTGIVEWLISREQKSTENRRKVHSV